MIVVRKCVTCSLPLTRAHDGEKERLCHDATLRDVVARALFLGVPVVHNLRQHATPVPVKHSEVT